MKLLVLSTSTNNTATVIDSVRSLGAHDIAVINYDRKFAEAFAQAVAINPSIRDSLLIHQWPAPGSKEREAWLQRCSMDTDMIEAAKVYKPDAILFISAWVGDFNPTHETLAALNAMAPMVHVCFDAADPPWWDQMRTFEEKGLFRLTVTIDGAHYWPGGKLWDRDWKIANALSVLTPCDPRYFSGPQVPFMTRPFAIAYAGNAGGWIRSHLVGLLQRHKGHIFTYRGRDDIADSYKNYCDFLRYSKCVISVPFTGSNATTHVKGRPVEAGWAGCALLEWKNAATAQWFIPRHEYWEFESVESCMEEAEYLAAHPRICEDMARALNWRVTTEHSPAKIWGAVFERLGLDQPMKAAAN